MGKHIQENYWISELKDIWKELKSELGLVAEYEDMADQSVGLKHELYDHAEAGANARATDAAARFGFTLERALRAGMKINLQEIINE